MRTLLAVLTTKFSSLFGFIAAATPATKPSLLVSGLMFALVHFTYLALIGVLLLAGMGIPIPEDVPLILSGYMCNEEHSPINSFPRMVDSDGDGIMEEVPRTVPHVYWMIVAGMFGVLAGDSIVFSIGRRGIDSDNFVARHIRKVMHSTRREKVERHFAKHGSLTIFCGRFMPGFRSLIFAFAGISRMSYLRFILIDGIAALISVPLFVLLGYYFAGQINQVFAMIERVKHILLPVMIVVGLGLLAIYFVRKRRLAGMAKNAAPGI